MGNKFVLFIKNFSYALSSNMVSFFVNALILLVLPKVIGVAEYGYIQYYTLLTSYIVCLHFGWNDGIYLRYGGRKYDQLNTQTFSQQFWGLILFSLAQIIFYLALLNSISVENNKYYVFVYIILSLVMVLPRIFISTILQISNRMKEYSVLLITERIFYALFLAIMIVSGIKSFKLLILGDLAGKLFSFIYGIKCCSNIVFTRPKFTKKTFVEFKSNIRAGIFIVLSNICSILITGIVQFLIETRWNIETFSKVALAFNISRMLMVVINSVSVVMFPLIKNVHKNELPILYMQIRKATMLILLALLIFYYPLRVLLTFWLPQYTDSFIYVALLLPLCIFESKSVMLVTTYLKALRRETLLFTVNLIVVMISLSLSFLTVYLMASLDLAVLSITISLAVKSLLLEYFVSKVIHINVSKDVIIELLIVSIFIISSWFMRPLVSFLIYLFIYGTYLFINRSEISRLKRLILKH